MSSTSAAIGALSARCARALGENGDLPTTKYALAAMLCVFDPASDTPAPPTASDGHGATATKNSSSSEVAAIKELLSNALGAASTREDLTAAGARHFSQWAAVVLETAALSWGHALTQAETDALFHSHFLRFSPRDSLEALAAALPDAATVVNSVTQRRTKTCVTLLSSLLHEGRVPRLFADHCFSSGAASASAAAAAAAASSEDDDEGLVSLLVSIPLRVANALRNAPPPALAPSAYYPALIVNLLRTLASSSSREEEEEAEGLSKEGGKGQGGGGGGGGGALRARAVGGLLLARIARQGYFQDALPPLLDGCHSDLLLAMPAGAAEKTLEAAVRYASEGHGKEEEDRAQSVCALFAPLLRASAAARLALSRRLLLLRVLPLPSVPILISLLKPLPGSSTSSASSACTAKSLPHWRATSSSSSSSSPTGSSPSGKSGGSGGGSGGGSLLHEALEGVAEVWCSSSHVVHAPTKQQAYVTEVLLQGLDALVKAAKAEADSLVLRLLNGVSVHLDAKERKIQKLGQKIAEKVSRIIDPNSQLDFEADDSSDPDEPEPPKNKTYGANDDWDREAAAMAGKASEFGVRSSSSNSSSKAKPAAPTNTSTSTAVRIGDAEADSDDESSDSDAESDVSYEAYDQTDDRSDLPEAGTALPRPRNLRRVLAGLQTKSDSGDHVAVDAALEYGAVLIRNAADAPELHAMAKPLCRALLHLPDAFKLARFEVRRQAALCAITARAPAECAALLTEEFYSESLSLGMRHDVLRTIHLVADELGAPPPSAKSASSDPLPQRQNKALEAAGMGMDAHSAVDASQKAGFVSADGKTRRFISARPHGGSASAADAAALAAAPSIGGVVAPLFFWPLIARYDEPAKIFRLLNEDCSLLSCLMHALAALLRSAAAYPCARPMGKLLLELAWAMHAHGEAVVRQGVLVALRMACYALHPADLDAQDGVLLGELRDWFLATTTEDPDQSCRQLAAACYSGFGAALTGGK